jgi:adhesin/invasin
VDAANLGNVASNTVTITNLTAAVTNSTLTVSPSVIRINGTDQATITATITDGVTAIPGLTVTFALNTEDGTILGPVIDNGDGTYTAKIVGNSIGSGIVSAAINGFNINATANITFQSPDDVAPTVVLSGAPASLSGNSPFTITATFSERVQGLDHLVNDFAVTGGTVTAISGGPKTYTVTIQPNTALASAVTISVPAGAATDFGPTTADPFGTNPSLASNTLSVSYAVNLTTSTITRSQASIVANGIATSTITVDLKDINGVALSGRTVAIAASLGSVTAVTPHPSVAGRYTASFSGTTTGTATVSYSVDGVTASGTTSVLLIASPPDLTNGPNGSTISASPTSLPADGVSPSLVIVRITDANGNPISGQTVVVQLVNNVSGGGTLGTFGLISDNADGTYFITLKAGTVVGTGTLQFTVGGVLAAKTVQMRLYDKNASASRSTITPSPSSIVADGVTTSTITVQLKDTNGNNLTSSGGTVTLSSNLGTLSSVTDNNNGTYTAVLTSSTTAGTATISGTVGGAAITGTATVTFTAGAADGARSTLTASPSSILADGVTTSTITVQLKDTNGNNLTSSGGTVVLSSTAGTLSSVTDNNNGTYTAVLTSSTTAGTATISGTVGAAAITATATVTFTAGAADGGQSTLTASPSSILADGVTTSTITVQLKDANGNNLSASGGTVVLSSTAGTLSSVTDNNNGTYTAVLTSSTTAGTATISGTVGAAAITGTATVTFTAGAVDRARSTLTASPSSILADGVTTSTITVQLKDTNGNNLTSSGGTVVLSSTAGTLSSVTDNNNGTYTAVLTSSTTAGTATISGTVGGAAITATATVTFTAGAADGARSTLTASPSSILADGVTTSTITVQLKDANGNNLTSSGGTVTLSSDLGTLSSVTDNNNGTYTAVLTSATTAGTATISGTVGAAAITGTATVTFTAGAVDRARSTLTASPSSIVADGVTTSTITVQLKDTNGNNLTSSGGTVVLSSTAGTLSSVTDNNNGTYTAVLTSSTTAGTATISGTVGGAAITATATVTFTAGAADGARSTLTASPSSILADGVTTSTITVQLKDANGNNLTSSGGTVTLSSDLGTLSSVTDNNNGTYTAVLTSATTAGTATISGTVGAAAITGTATVTFTAGAVDRARSTLTASPSSILADGVTTSTITVQLKDTNGNNLTSSGGTVVLSSTAGTLSSVTDNNNGTYTAVLTSSTTAGTATISGTVGGAAITATATVTFTAGAADGARSTLTASPSSILADGVTTSTITVQLKDANGNNLTSSGGTVTLSSDLGTLSSVTDNNNGTYTAVLTSTTSAGTATISGTVGGAAITATATVTFTAGAVDGARSTLTASPTSILADGVTTSTITVQLKDANGNNLTSSGGTVVLSSTAGTLSSVTDNNNGTYTAVLTSSTTAGTATISGTVGGAAITATATVTFTAGAVDGARSTLTASPSSILADGVTTSTITVQLKDANGNNLSASGGTVVLSSTAGTLSSVTDNNNGTYTAVLTSTTTAGTATISGTVGGAAITATATVTFTAGPQVTLSGGPNSITNLSEFVITASFSVPVSGFHDVLADVSIAHGRVIAITGGPSIYSLVIAPSGTADLSITIPANAAQDSISAMANDVSNTLVFKDQISETTKAGIERFLVWRAHNLISNQPALTRFLQGQGCGQMTAHASEGASSVNGCLLKNKTWADISSASSARGSYTLASFGVHDLINPNFLIGGMIQIDHANDLEEQTFGRGVLVGPYFVARLRENPVYFEGRLLFGSTENAISQTGASSERFNTDRWLVQLRASGEYDFAKATLMPSVDFTSTQDHQRSFTDSLGHTIASQSVNLMQISVGVDFRVPVATSHGSLEITGGLARIYTETNAAWGNETSASRNGKLQLGLHYDTSQGTEWRLNVFSDLQGSNTLSQGLALTVEKTF